MGWYEMFAHEDLHDVGGSWTYMHVCWGSWGYVYAGGSWTYMHAGHINNYHLYYKQKQVLRVMETSCTWQYCTILNEIARSPWVPYKYWNAKTKGYMMETLGKEELDERICVFLCIFVYVCKRAYAFENNRLIYCGQCKILR